MPYGDGIERINCYSLTDFHDFDFCPFRFFVKHHLNKKYEIEEGNPAMALGSLLDQSIKLFHKSKAYGQPSEYLINIVRAAFNEIRENVARTSGPSFYSSIVPFLDHSVISEANKIFVSYYGARNKKINRSLGYERFSEWVMEGEDGRFKLWGGADAYEIGDDGMPEVVDYKSRQNLEKGKNNLDMDLMPKIYVLLASKFLKNKGYDKARFKVRIWQDPLNEDYYEEFDLQKIGDQENLFKQKINRILAVSEIKFCGREFCKACKSDKRDELIKSLAGMGIYV
ncbi:PD-(D/E)XK nuclease family protein [Candidatus Daviesbacteria bacterium]|nr:PD-(D/E)XK nuclease family protein [Candidatus Daviesbacteria bacterium]